ncbi:MAG: hypothetical protein N2376_07795 [Clostridia bacterium]|nr:hypothetical protein [Clostridia bacterium]
MITIEQIDEFRKRTHSSYEDAKYFLEKNNGDVLEAIIDFERTKSGKSQQCYQRRQPQDDFGKRFAEILQKGFDTRIFVEDRNATLFTIPVILLILLIPLWFVIILFFLFLMMLGYKFSIRDVKSQNINVNSFFQNISDKMKDTGSHKDRPQPRSAPYAPQPPKSQVPVPSDMTPPAAPEAPNPNKEQNKEEGFKEYTIE